MAALPGNIPFEIAPEGNRVNSGGGATAGTNVTIAYEKYSRDGTSAYIDLLLQFDGAVAGGATLATLPVGFRPATTLAGATLLNGVLFDGAAVESLEDIAITTAGVVTSAGMTTAADGDQMRISGSFTVTSDRV